MREGKWRRQMEKPEGSSREKTRYDGGTALCQRSVNRAFLHNSNESQWGASKLF